MVQFHLLELIFSWPGHLTCSQLSNTVIEANMQGGLMFMCFSTMHIYYP